MREIEYMVAALCTVAVILAILHDRLYPTNNRRKLLLRTAWITAATCYALVILSGTP